MMQNQKSDGGHKDSRAVGLGGVRGWPKVERLSGVAEAQSGA